MSHTQSCMSRSSARMPAYRQTIKEFKKVQAANQLKATVLSLLPRQDAKVKLSRGTFEVKFVRAIENEQKAEVLFEDGQVSLVKWTDFDFKPVVEHKTIQNDYGQSCHTLPLPLY